MTWFSPCASAHGPQHTYVTLTLRILCTIVHQKTGIFDCLKPFPQHRPATVECATGDTEPDRGGVLALRALKLAIVRDGGETLCLTSATRLGGATCYKNCLWM